MKTKVMLSNPEHTVGFLHIEGFEGVKIGIALEYLKRAIKNIEEFEERGLAPVKIVLGIETANPDMPGLVIFFLDEQETCGIAIAPIIGERGEE